MWGAGTGDRVVQVKGQVRGSIQAPADADQDTIGAAARAETRVAELLADSEVVKTIVVPGRLVNFVTK